MTLEEREPANLGCDWQMGILCWDELLLAFARFATMDDRRALLLMKKELLSGNAAVARGAYEAGVRVAAAYPGTPSTEILEHLAHYNASPGGVYSEWSPNEKVALDVAIGAAYAGSRAMAVMKHVGLNVAADAFFYISMTGIEAGLVIVSADDPNMYSSQNEQDNRRYAKFARVPCLEPSDSQEAKDLVGVALDMSEQFDGPVMLRLTTRISHSDTLVELGHRRILPLHRCGNRKAKFGIPRNWTGKKRFKILIGFVSVFPHRVILPPPIKRFLSAVDCPPSILIQPCRITLPVFPVYGNVRGRSGGMRSGRPFSGNGRP